MNNLDKIKDMINELTDLMVEECPEYKEEIEKEREKVNDSINNINGKKVRVNTKKRKNTPRNEIVKQAIGTCKKFKNSLLVIRDGEFIVSKYDGLEDMFHGIGGYIKGLYELDIIDKKDIEALFTFIKEHTYKK